MSDTPAVLTSAAAIEPTAVEIEMQHHRLSNQNPYFFLRVATRDTSRQIGHVGRERPVSGPFNHHDIIHREPHFIPACLRRLFNVPIGTSCPSFPPPGTVTVPGFWRCRYCKWLPAVRSRNQPSASSNLIASRYFIQSSVPSSQRSSRAHSREGWMGQATLRMR